MYQGLCGTAVQVDHSPLRKSNFEITAAVGISLLRKTIVIMKIEVCRELDEISNVNNRSLQLNYKSLNKETLVLM